MLYPDKPHAIPPSTPHTIAPARFFSPSFPSFSVLLPFPPLSLSGDPK